MKIKFLKSGSEFRAWLSKNHDKAEELYLGFYKTHTDKKGITYQQALDAALCFGWIDAVRKSIDDSSYTIRFTKRKPRSIWSNINKKRVEELIQLGLMQPSGLKAFSAREEKRTGIYSFEKEPVKLDPGYEKKFKKNKKAWTFFQSKAPWYKRTANHWIMRAKKEETRLSRLETLIRDSENQQDINLLRRRKG